MRIKGYKELRLYYPNLWRRYVGGLVTDEDKTFSWFLCSQRYQDKNSLYVVEISGSAKFFDEDTGETFEIKKDNKVILIILDDPENKKIPNFPDLSKRDAESKLLRLMREKSYQGYAYLQKCESKYKEELVVCKEAVFWISEDVLRIPKRDSSIIIDYARRNNECLRKVIPGFPSTREIDESLAVTSKKDVCKILYDDIREHMEETM